MIDLRFPTALQMVLSLAVAHGHGVRCTSAELADGLGANPVLVRKLLKTLARDGIVIAATGKNGGVRLGRAPERITVQDVYASAVADKRLFAARPDIPGRCVVSRNIERYFAAVNAQAEEGVSTVLAKTTIAQSLASIRQMDTA